MLGFKPNFSASSTVLCLGAHCDDIEIGCGGTLMEIQQRHPGIRFVWVVFSSDATRESETRMAARRMLGDEANCLVEAHSFRGSYLPYHGAEIKDAFEAIKARYSPDLVLTHYLSDRHQDHRVIAEFTWNTFRNHAILEYEIPKFEGDLAHPNVYVPISPEAVERKIGILLECFPSQHSRSWFDAELFRGVMRLRGVECNAPNRYAEAFHARKICL
ncbi:MAG: PIG-L deacetylase family protein [Steroidobacteraceae bacterium]